MIQYIILQMLELDFYWTNLNPPRAIIEKYKQEGGWKTYQDIMSPTPLRKNMVPHTTKGKNKYKFVKSKDNDFGLSLHHWFI